MRQQCFTSAACRIRKGTRTRSPDTLTSANNLATLYSDQGKYDEAAVLYKRSFAGREKALGPDHPHTLRSANNLANLYKVQRKYDEAAVLYKRSFAGHEKGLGPDHLTRYICQKPRTLYSDQANMMRQQCSTSGKLCRIRKGTRT